MKTYDSIILYHFESCPFCQKVRRFAKQNNILLAEKDIRLDSKARDELIGIGGKSQVPCLVADGIAIYESDDIIDWLTDVFIS